MLHLVSVHSELANFICKQLKRPVAFGAVHFDVKPQIVICNLFILPFLNFIERLW